MNGAKRRRGISLAMIAGLVAIAIALVLVASACSSKNKKDNTQPTQPSGTTPSAIDYGSLSGDVRIDGSSTVGPLTEAVAEEFRSKAPDVHVNVGISGTGGGFEKFCNGETQISDASRQIKQTETDACAANGITDIVEFQVAIDALTVAVNPQNDFINCLTVQQLHDLFKTGGISNWKDLDPSYPDKGIKFYYPGTDSGTFDYFLGSIITKLDANATHRSDGTPSEDDNVLALGIENDRNAIGYFGFSYFEESGGALKAVSIDNGAGCVAPSVATAVDGTYAPLSRPLFIYTRASFLREKPQVLGFINYYLDSTESLVPDVGFIPMAADVSQQQITKLEPFLP